MVSILGSKILGSDLKFLRPFTILSLGKSVIHWEVEKIAGKRIRKYGKGSRAEFLVQWKGFTREFNTWEPLENLLY